MGKAIIVTVLILGNSQTAGRMGRLLEQYYTDHGIHVQREAASGKGVNYFLSATRPETEVVLAGEDVLLREEVLMFHPQRQRIRDRLKEGVGYVIVASLGGNDAWKGCCRHAQRKKMIRRYHKLFKQLCASGAIVIFNGSPPADIRVWRRFDSRRAELDLIQQEASQGTCVIRNSLRHMKIKPDPDGYHYNRSAELYVKYLLALPGMTLPVQESLP